MRFQNPWSLRRNVAIMIRVAVHNILYCCAGRPGNSRWKRRLARYWQHNKLKEPPAIRHLASFEGASLAQQAPGDLGAVRKAKQPLVRASTRSPVSAGRTGGGGRGGQTVLNYWSKNKEADASREVVAKLLLFLSVSLLLNDNIE